MLFNDHLDIPLAISQPAHAWIAGQILRAWGETLDAPLILAAEQHDLGWMDWERAPSFDPCTGRPHLFRAVGAAVHAPFWTLGVERALAAWGTHVALLISRHGGVIYRASVGGHQHDAADGAAAAGFLATQAPLEAGWARALGLDAAALDRQTALLTFADRLSLAVCGELATPLTLQAPGRAGGMVTHRLAARDGARSEFLLSPWPFEGGSLVLRAQARALPPGGRLADEAAMRRWLASPDRVWFEPRLLSG